MKKYPLIFLSALLLFGCAKKPACEKIIARVNDYEITDTEFRQALRSSSYGLNNTPESRELFLNNLINQKLILQEAQREGLDKEEYFLKLIEKFWEQSLLKVALDKKSKQIADSVHIDDSSVRQAYEQMLKEGKTSKPYNEASGSIKWELMKSKETLLMNEWINALRAKAQIKVNKDLLK
jgi:peptidyl-prolyl cis-trans isomerase C